MEARTPEHTLLLGIIVQTDRSSLKYTSLTTYVKTAHGDARGKITDKMKLLK